MTELLWIAGLGLAAYLAYRFYQAYQLGRARRVATIASPGILGNLRAP